ncbi:zinc finger protein OZF-like [Vanessa atalanta]|uniref:zinc finger protein OZF-like n=1 Tax=Vanessa atalanta TaxID=42275 RepID=UPI001FCD9DBB|nr:zinc finger protein OZF-like [Vanessa atalanta]
MDSLICRICLDKTGTVSVFDKENDNIQYSAKLMRLVNNIVSEEDGLPSMMCFACANDLSLAYQFVQKCEASDKALRCLSAPIELYSDLQTNIELNIKEEDVKREIDDCDDQDDSFSNSFLLENCSKEYFQQQKESSTQSNAVQIIDERNISIEIENETERQNSKSDNSSNGQDNNDKKCKIMKGKFHRNKVRRGKLGPIQCVICGLMTSSPSAMEIHMRTHTGEKPFVCTSCGAKFSSKGLLKRHNETFHSTRERKFTCETCGSSFFRKNDIISHLRVHTDERPYVCPYCSKRFRQVASRNRHQIVHTGEKPFSCPICNKKFAHKSLVKKHQSVHSDERKYACHLCNKSFKSRPALNVHIGLHTNEKQNVCSFCGMAFAMKGNLQTHIRRIHSEKSGQCSICLKTFSDLEVHMRKHTGEKPYICGTCNAAFAVKRSLAHHMIFKHENAGKFKCSIGDCTKTFPTATMLEFHLLKQHTNHTPYICQHCPRRFFRTSDLSRHLRASHMDINFKPSMKTQISKPVMYS